MSSPGRLLEILRNKGALTPDWEPAVAAVDRAHFVPDTFEVGSARSPAPPTRRSGGGWSMPTYR